LQVKVFVTPKRGILDPQGRAIEHSLKSLGFNQVGHVNVGKYIVLEIEAASAAEAREIVTKMCDQLLANTVIEDYRVEVSGG
jgi:phosphoribosylformylglycinamidine synthase PurS subunit